MPVAAIFRDRPRGPDAVVGDEAREAPLSEKESSPGGFSETGLGGPRCCEVICNEVRSGQLRELLGDFGVSRIPVVDVGGAAVGR